MQFFQKSVQELITQTSTNLPPDVRQAMAAAVTSEQPSTKSSQALAVIATNIDMACDDQGPICQDTGMPTFEIKTPVGVNQLKMKKMIRAAVVEATKLGKLRPNSVDSLTGKNSGDNLGPGTPILHFDQWENDQEIEIKLLLKGGGCENKNIQYSVPCELPQLGRADRTMDGVRKCILHAVWQAQGQGCSAGAIGVCIGGDRTSGYTHDKEQLFRTLDDVNPDPELAKLETYIMAAANTLGIGTMGFGGGVTLIGCKVGVLNRLPASFFVSVAYDCWAFRRLGVVLDARTGAIRRWLYKEDGPALRMTTREGLASTGREIPLRPPLAESDVRKLKVGDVVLISGVLHTGRDAGHPPLNEAPPPVRRAGKVPDHRGPGGPKGGGGWGKAAAGPATRNPERADGGEGIGRHGGAGGMGKGGDGPEDSCRTDGA